MFDVLLRNGAVVDGTGSPSAGGDVAVSNGRIAAIGDLSGAQATTTLDAGGRIVCPGFIDLHTHCSPESNLNYLQQGVTLVVSGNCGFSGIDIRETVTRVAEAQVGPNLAMLIGHNSVRQEVIGKGDRPATQAEMDEMKRLVADAMRNGAMGFSTGLAYIPGAFTETEEVIELARAASGHGGYYTSHMRDEGEHVMDSLEETIRIGRESGMPAHVSHHKVAGVRYHGASVRTIALIEKTRGEGFDVTADQYPYTASCGRIGLLLPQWSRGGDDDEARARFDDPEQRDSIKEHIIHTMDTRSGGDASRVMIASCNPDRSIEGKTLADISRERNRGADPEDTAETVIQIARMSHPSSSDTMCVYHTMSEEDVRRIMACPHVAIASDGWGPSRRMGVPHPRCYGTFPRALGHYCRELRLFPMEEAVRKMTWLPASRLGLKDRGVLREGAWADIVVFDPDTIADKATFEDPAQYPAGIDYVLVNGTLTIDHGEHTGQYPGRFIPRPGT